MRPIRLLMEIPMSLTSLLDRPAVRSRINAHLRLPPVLPGGPPKVPAGSAHRGLVGMAFEFALAAGLRSRAPRVYGELGAPRLALGAIESWGPTAVAACRLPELRERVVMAEEALRRPTGDALTAECARAAFDLAAVAALARAPAWFRADIVARGRMLLFEPPGETVSELRQLHALVPWPKLVDLGRVHLAPTFPRIAEALGGADADLLLGDTLVEVKAGAAPRVRREDLRQAAVLGALARRFGIVGAEDVAVTEVGVYVARTGTLHRFELDTLVVPDGVEAIVDALLLAAREVRP